MTFAPTTKPVAANQVAQTIELLSRSKLGQKIAVQPGQALQIVVDGQIYTGQKKIKGQTLNLKRKGNALLLVVQGQEEPLLEVNGFYAPSPADTDASLSADAIPVDALSLLQQGSSTQMAAADLGGSAPTIQTPSWGTLVAQANTTTVATSTTATTATTNSSSGLGLVFGALALAAAAGGSKSSGSGVPTDTTPPTLVISDNAPDTAKGDVTFTFKFSEAITGFDASQVTVANGTKGLFTALSANEYSLVVTPAANTQGNITLSVSNTGVKDASGNALAAVPNYTQAFDSVVVPVDTTPPTATVTDNTTGTASGPVTYTIAFNEAVKGFDVSKLSLAGGTLSGFVANPDAKTFTVLATPDLVTSGTLKLSVNPSGIADSAGNAMTVAPTVADQVFAQNLLQGTIMAGPVISTNSLTVNVFNATTGQLVGSTPVSATGMLFYFEN